MGDIVFLTMDQVEAIHGQQLAAFGGQDGYLSRGVVESAIAQPGQGMFGQYLHTDLAHMAAAYLFHLATTQGFLDGNNRTAIMCALTFLDTNGYEVKVEPMEIYNLAMNAAINDIDKDQIADWFREHMTPIGPE